MADGMNYAPEGKPSPVVKPGEFPIAAVAFDHGHIGGQVNGLCEAGATLKWVYDPDPKKYEAMLKKFPEAKVARSLDEVLQDKEVKLVAAAAVPSDRGPLGVKVMEHGKDYFTDKTPFTEMSQLVHARNVVAQTGRKYMVYFSERLHVEAAVHAGTLIDGGAIGRVVQVIGMGPHNLNAPVRPAWFFQKAKYGGILADIGSHQTEQFLHYAKVKKGKVQFSQVGNFGHPEFPELEDFGDATLVGDNGTSMYYRVDWHSPSSLPVFGDGRTFILGTKGYIELRKYIDVAREKKGGNVYLVDDKGEHYIDVVGKVGFPFFGELILDCFHRTEKAMTQAHAFEAAELCLTAQAMAVRIGDKV